MQNENGVLAVREDFGNALVDKYVPIWDKKYRSKGESIWVFQRRTLSSACQVATTLHDMDFAKASTFLFHLVREAEECKPIIEAVSSQVELAMANPDNFIKGYHQFLQGLTKPIKKNKDYALYFKAIAYAQECVHSGLSIDENVERNDSVLYAVIDMLMQGSEYLKPQEFDIVNNIVGISTENEPIIIRDPYPLADVPVYYSEALFNNRPYDKCDFQISEDRRLDMVFSYYKRYGYENVADFDSINDLALLSHLYTNTVLSMATYVNEYTVDMLPDKPLIENTPNMWSWWPKPISPKYTTEFLKDTLHHRRRTLPANGALFQFDVCQLIQEIKLKETCRDNEIVCLYKIVTKFGDLAGYYNTSTEWFYILTDRAQFPELVDSVTNLILWLYTSLACDLPDVLPTDASFRSSFVTHADAPFGIRCLMIGGKPRDYRKKGNGGDEPLRAIPNGRVRCPHCLTAHLVDSFDNRENIFAVLWCYPELNKEICKAAVHEKCFVNFVDIGNLAFLWQGICQLFNFLTHESSLFRMESGFRLSPNVAQVMVPVAPESIWMSLGKRDCGFIGLQILCITMYPEIICQVHKADGLVRNALLHDGICLRKHPGFQMAIWND